MATLEQSGTGARCQLRARHLIGRSHLAHLRLQEPSISGEHALICWTGKDWEVHDLGSRNGTFFNGRKLAKDERAMVRRGDTIAFGHLDNTWRLADSSPPTAMAVPKDGGTPRSAQDSFLALPSEQDPTVVIYQDRTGDWLCERNNGVTRVVDGQDIAVGGTEFVLHLPDALSPTLGSVAEELAIDNIALRFAVSHDEEYVELTVLHGNRAIHLGNRAHHYVLLTLARARLSDRRNAPADSTGGWLYQEELANMLHMDDKHLNITVFRCRQQFSAAGVIGAAAIVERRRPTRQLRLGVQQIEIVHI